MIGRPTVALPPHQMWNAPTVPSSAPAANSTSSASRRGRPRAASIATRPVSARNSAGANAITPYS